MALKEGDWVYVSDISLEDAKEFRRKRIYLFSNNLKCHGCVEGLHSQAYRHGTSYETVIWKYVAPVEEEKMNEREEALKRIEAAEKEITAAKQILNSPEKDLRIGKICVCADTLVNLADSRYVGIVSEVRVGDVHPIRTIHRGYWKFARLLTEEEKEKYL